MLLSGSPIIGSQDELANQPDAGDVPNGYVFFATDTEAYYVAYNGTWYEIGGGGGGGGVFTLEQLSGNAVEIAPSDSGMLTFDTVVGSLDTLVDLTDPAAPAFVDAGTYIVGVTVAPTTPMTPGDSYDGLMKLDATGLDAPVTGTATAGSSTFPYLALTNACAIGGGHGLTVEIFNTSAETYSFCIVSCWIQRIA